MSGLMLSSVDTGGVPTGRAEQLKSRLPIVPSTTREFRPSDELVIFAEVYDNERVKPHTVDVTATILGEDRSKAISRHQEQRSSADLAANGGTFSYAAQIPLKDLKPGIYSVRFEAISRLNTETSVVREVQFSVTPR